MNQLAHNNFGFCYIWTKKTREIKSLKRKNNKIRTFVQYFDTAGNLCCGYSFNKEKKIPFALCVRKSFGNGVYTSNIDGKSYFLIIRNMEIVYGTDIFIDEHCLNWYNDRFFRGHAYDELPRLFLDEECINKIAEEHNYSEKNKKKKMWVSILAITSTIIISALIIHLVT